MFSNCEDIYYNSIKIINVYWHKSFMKLRIGGDKMKEIIFTISSTIFLYLLTKIIPSANKFATTILDVLPLFPSVFMYTYNKPKIYLKTLSFKDLGNITYMLSVQINNCKIKLNNFKDIENYLVNIKNYKGKKTNDYCYKGNLFFSKLEVATNVIDFVL